MYRDVSLFNWLHFMCKINAPIYSQHPHPMYFSETGIDSFGRLESVYCYMAVNLFKLDVYNAMVVLKTHEPLKWNQEQFVDMFEMAEKW